MFLYNTTSQYDEWEKILESLGGEPISDEEVWEIAREYTEIPHIGNIELDLIANRIKCILENKYGSIASKFDYYINGELDSHLYFDGEHVYSIDDFNTILDRLKNEHEI